MSAYFIITLLIPLLLTAIYFCVFVVCGRDEDMHFARGVMYYLSYAVIVPVMFLIVETIISGNMSPAETRRLR